MNTVQAQEVLVRIKAASRVLLTMHRRPDPDSIGSAAAMAEFLAVNQIPSAYYCSTGLPAEAQFFGLENKSVLNPQTLSDAASSFDLIITFDAGDLKHAGLADYPREGRPFLINFDHHATNAHFGNLNIVEVSYASTTELLYHFFEVLRFPISARVASYLLAGLLADTDHFFNPATTASALQVAGLMMSKGVTLTELRQFLFERRAIKALNLVGEILARLYRHPEYAIAATYLTEEDLIRHGISADELEGVANMLNVIGDAKAMLFLKSEGGFIRGSLRTTSEDINVGRLAELMGGGGHRKAAGFTISGALRAEGKSARVI